MWAAPSLASGLTTTIRRASKHKEAPRSGYSGGLRFCVRVVYLISWLPSVYAIAAEKSTHKTMIPKLLIIA